MKNDCFKYIFSMILFTQCIIYSEILNFQNVNSNRIYTYQEHLLKNPVPTEEIIYKTLLKNSLDLDINYIAIPWTYLINNNSLHTIPNHISIPKNNFTVCQHAYFDQYVPKFKQLGIEIVFTPAARNDFDYQEIITVPYTLHPVNGVNPARTKDIYYSFIGFCKTHPIRYKLFEIKHPPHCVMIKRDTWGIASQNNHRNEYKNILSRSRFSLCPRGTSPNSIRFWESLQAGAIPILISDVLQLPEIIDWEKCIVRVPENKVAYIPEILKQITLEQEKEMRKACIETYHFFFDNPLLYIKLMLKKIYENNQ